MNRGLDKYHEEPLQSVPLKYSITVGTVPVWKVKSVAGYKRGKYLKVMQEQQLHQHQHRALQEKEATAMAGGSSSDGAAAAAAMVVAAASSSSSSGRGASTSTRTRSNDVAAAVANTAAGGDGAASAVSTGNGGMHQQPTETPVPPEGFDRGAGGLPDPMLGLSIANKSMLHSLSGEELRAEMAKMNFNCGLIKKELCSLEKFRAGLVWMMDKSAMYQVQRHHNGDGIKAGAYGQRPQCQPGVGVTSPLVAEPRISRMTSSSAAVARAPVLSTSTDSTSISGNRHTSVRTRRVAPVQRAATRP